MRGILIINHYLKSDKFIELSHWLIESAKMNNIDLSVLTNREIIIGLNDNKKLDTDFILFWDKDVLLANHLENKGYRLFNCAKAIELCDDKGKTYVELLKYKNIVMPETIVAPLNFFKYNKAPDFLLEVSNKLGFPLIMKERCGSFGMNVYLVKTYEELCKLFLQKQGMGIIFQKFIESSYGRDIRIHVVGGKVVASMYRYSNKDFRANITNGGNMAKYQPNSNQIDMAVQACEKLGLDFAGVDLLFDNNNNPILCEVNSNAHFINIYKCTGINIADHIFDHIKNVVKR